MPPRSTDLYGLLPEYLRRADYERGKPLEALLQAAEKQGQIVYDDITRLWSNFFAETCDDALLPYLADLIALNLIDDDPANNRREVARTIAYRRRKGTVPQLETMAGDVTGYSCRVAEFFERLQWNQSMIHFRSDCLNTIDVRDRSALARIGGAFDRSQHIADLRPSTQKRGWHNIRKIGFFLWRLRAIPLRGVEAKQVPAKPGAYHFNALGQTLPLFQSPDPLERGASADWPRTGEHNVMAPIAPFWFREDPAAYIHTPLGFTIYRNGVPVASPIIPANLCAWVSPDPNKVAVDVRLGRILFGTGLPLPAGTVVTVDDYFGFSGNVGGGGYDRRFSNPGADLIQVSKAGAVKTVSDALALLAASTAPVRIVEITDSRTYAEPKSWQLPASFTTLIVRAASGQRPTVVLSATQQAFLGPTAGQHLEVSGIQFTGTGRPLTIPQGVATVSFQDCTIDPGGGTGEDGVTARPAGVTLQVQSPGNGVQLALDHCLAGALNLPDAMDCLTISDSVIDAQPFGTTALAAGPPAVVLRSTILGDFRCVRLEASEALIRGTTKVLMRQEGCVRFSYFGPGSDVPRRYECAPPAPPPVFTTTLFGAPGYTQLALDCPASIATGGEDGREIGVWASLGAPRRLEHLNLRLAEYLPAGLQPAIVFVT
ncbi:phage tail protein [uncultured Paludibaculum sp.]|uniref:phage tail protein n=1 Tax=uncultured Paludibaculum sp. TaxID=1765020 RepID=UPI002AAC15DA|nr:phage tail protein [uncultured Paludibaculum sp.]